MKKKDTTNQNLRDASKGKYIVVNAYVRKDDRFQINNLTAHFIALRKEELTKPKARRKEIIKIRAQMTRS